MRTDDYCESVVDGYNLGTPVLKPYRQATKPNQNDTALQEKPI